MKVCFIDVTHWHAPSYYRTLRELTGVAALTARNPQTGKGVAEGLGAKFYEDYREMVQRERPDFVFALGRHCEMAETVRASSWRKRYPSPWKNPWVSTSKKRRS